MSNKQILLSFRSLANIGIKAYSPNISQDFRQWTSMTLRVDTVWEWNYSNGMLVICGTPPALVFQLAARVRQQVLSRSKLFKSPAFEGKVKQKRRGQVRGNVSQTFVIFSQPIGNGHLKCTEKLKVALTSFPPIRPNSITESCSTSLEMNTLP